MIVNVVTAYHTDFSHQEAQKAQKNRQNPFELFVLLGG